MGIKTGLLECSTKTAFQVFLIKFFLLDFLHVHLNGAVQYKMEKNWVGPIESCRACKI